MPPFSQLRSRDASIGHAKQVSLVVRVGDQVKRFGYVHLCNAIAQPAQSREIFDGKANDSNLSILLWFRGNIE